MKFNKAIAGAAGAWLAQGLAIITDKLLGLPMDPNVEAWFTTVLIGLLVWLVPNADARR